MTVPAVAFSQFEYLLFDCSGATETNKYATQYQADMQHYNNLFKVVSFFNSVFELLCLLRGIFTA